MEHCVFCRFKAQFEDCRTESSEFEESQDWFVNDHKSSEHFPTTEITNETSKPSCVSSRTTAEMGVCDIMEDPTPPDTSLPSNTRAKSASLLKRIVASGFRLGEEIDPEGAAFLHHMPIIPAGVLVMELGKSKDQVQ